MRKMRYISMLLCLLCAFGVIACDCDDDSAATNTQDTDIVISGNAALSRIDGAEVKLFHYGEKGSEIEIIAANAPVITSSSGEYEFQVNRQDVQDLGTPLVLRSTGGTMGGQPAPELEALIADPGELASAKGNITRHLSAASSVAARMLKDTVAATGSAPETKDAEGCIATVEKALDVDLTEDPSDVSQAVAIENMCICQDLDLFDTPDNNSAVQDYIQYVAANLSKADEEDSATAFDAIGSGSLAKFEPPLFYRLKVEILRKSILANQCDNTKISISLRNGWGKVIEHAQGEVELEIVSGEGLLSNTQPTLKNGRARVSITSGTPGTILILANYKRENGKEITQSAIIKVIDAE